MLGISHHSAEDNGRSVVYTLPATGGTPEARDREVAVVFPWLVARCKWLVYTGGKRQTTTSTTSTRFPPTAATKSA